MLVLHLNLILFPEAVIDTENTNNIIEKYEDEETRATDMLIQRNEKFLKMLERKGQDEEEVVVGQWGHDFPPPPQNDDNNSRDSYFPDNLFSRAMALTSHPAVPLIFYEAWHLLFSTDTTRKGDTDTIDAIDKTTGQ